MNEMIFSWAEDANGRMVHVDNVSQGLKCGCTCPCCHEPLQARQGGERAHGFAHHSDKRRANLKNCYMVTMYKLAEQIIQQEKKIRVPSYYGIFKEKELEFTDVVVDNRYDRIDKQPDVIATTADGKQYLIEFTFDYKVQHKEKVDYEKLNCVEIDLCSQTFETLQNFLMLSNKDRRWLNNQTYFESIESVYSKKDKKVRVTDESECVNCDLKDECCGIRLKEHSSPITIENSGSSYRICKVEEYNQRKRLREKECEDAEKQRLLLEQEQRELYERQRLQIAEADSQERVDSEEAARKWREQEEAERIETSKISPESRTCFMCKSNLKWMCQNDEYAHCGQYISLGVPKYTPPETAKICRRFRISLEKGNT